MTGFNDYAFNKARSSAYGVEAEALYCADFMAAVLTNGKGFYTPLVCVLECRSPQTTGLYLIRKNSGPVTRKLRHRHRYL